MIDRQIRPTPQEILTPSVYGQHAYNIIREVQERTEAQKKYPGEVYSQILDDQPELKFGNLQNLKEKHDIVINSYYIPDSEGIDDWREDCDELISFETPLAVELLSQVKPGEKVTVKGPATYTYSKERYCFMDPHGDINIHIKTPVMLTLGLELSNDLNTVIITYGTVRTDGKPTEGNLPEKTLSFSKSHKKEYKSNRRN